MARSWTWTGRRPRVSDPVEDVGFRPARGTKNTYGPALPLLYGTARCDGIPVLVNQALVQEVNNVWSWSEKSGSWNTASGTVAPAEVAFCKGPAHLNRRAWSGQQVIWINGEAGALEFIGRQGTVPEWKNGDGFEKVWPALVASQVWTNYATVTIRGPITAAPFYDEWSAPDTASFLSITNVVSIDAPHNGMIDQFNISDTWTEIDHEPNGSEVNSYYIASQGVLHLSQRFPTVGSVQITFTVTNVGYAGYDASSALPLKGVAHLRNAAMLLPSEGALPDISLELRGAMVPVGYGPNPLSLDAHPADVLVHLMTDPIAGLGFPASALEVDHGPDGLVASGYRTYCTAMGFGVSRYISDRDEAGKLIEELLVCTNSTAFWSGGTLKVVPLGDTTVGSYVPPSVATALGVDELLQDGTDDTIAIERSAQSDVFNAWPVSYLDREAGYESVTEEADLELDHGNTAKRASTTDLPWIVEATTASIISELLAKRSVFVRNTFRFKLGPRWALLEPGDWISLTEPVFGLSGQLARITAIEEGDDGVLSVWAEELQPGAAHPRTLTPVTQRGDGLRRGLGTTPYATTYGLQAQGRADQSALSDLSNLVDGANDWDNIWPNPNSQLSGTPGGPGWSNTKVVGTGTAYAGDTVRFLQADASQRYYEERWQFPVGSSDAFKVEAQCRQNLSATLTGGLDNGTKLDFSLDGNTFGTSSITSSRPYLAVRYRDVAQTLLTESIAYHSLSSPHSSVWQKVALSATMPLGAVWAELAIGLDAIDPSYNQAEAWFDAIYARRMVGGDVVKFGTLSGSHLIAATITADKLTADCLETSNYAQDGSGNPTAGAKLDSVGTALKVAAGNLQVGKYPLSQIIKMGECTTSGVNPYAYFYWPAPATMSYADTDYFVIATPSGHTGTPLKDSNDVIGFVKFTDHVTLTTYSAPGAGNSVTFDVFVIHTLP